MRVPLRRSAPPLLLVTLAACSASGPSAPASPSAPRVFQPGAPGQASRPLTPEELAALEVPEHTEADVRFMQGMIPHHAQALRMTALARQKGESDLVRDMALRMEISQKDEVALMQRWLEERGAAAPSYGPDAPLPMMPGMLTPEQTRALADATGETFDRLFLELMIQHHAGALTMVRRLFATPGGGQETEIYQFASEVEVDQTLEIQRMQAVLDERFADRPRR